VTTCAAVNEPNSSETRVMFQKAEAELFSAPDIHKSFNICTPAT